MTPLDKVEVLYRDLVLHYEDAEDAEVRAASKLLMAALYNLRQHAGRQWHEVVQEYLEIIQQDPDKFERFMDSNRSEYQDSVLVIPVHDKPERYSIS